MWILTNQQGAWWCNALQLPSEKMLWNPTFPLCTNVLGMRTNVDCLVLSCAMQSNGVATWAFSDDWKWWHIKSLHFVWFSAAMTKFYAIYPVIWHHNINVMAHNINVMAHNLGSFNVYKSTNFTNKSDISYLKTSRAFDVLIHSGKPNSVG